MKKKRGLCMAAGGLIGDVDESARRRAEIAAKYGVTTGESAPAPQPPASPPAPAPVPAPQRRGGLMGAFDALTNRKRQIEGAAGYAQGGIVRGPGGPEDDEVPMQIAGKDVRLSNTEAVLPARTVQALGGPKAVEQLIEQTNGKPPVKGGLREGGEYYGGLIDDFGDRVKAQGQMPPVTVNDSVTGQTVKPNVRPTIAGQQDFRANAPQPAPQTSAPGAQASAVPQPGAATGQTAKAATPAASRLAQVSENFGRTLGKAYGSTPTPKVAMGNVLGPVIAGGLELADKDQSRLFNDPDAPIADKLRTFGRATTRLVGGVGGGALGMGVGSAAGPIGTFGGGALGGVSGAVAGDELGEAIFGDPVGDYKKMKMGEATASDPTTPSNILTPEQVAAAKAAHANVMAGGGNGNGSVAPIGIDNALLPQKPVAGGKLDAKVKSAEAIQKASVPIDPVTRLPVGLAAAAKANDGRADFNATMDASKYNPAEGTGVITRAPGKGGLRSGTFIGGPSADDAARDAKFEAAGYGKDAYGNWMTPERQKLQQAGKEWEDRNYIKRAGGSVNPSALSKGQQELLKKALTPYEGTMNGQLTVNQINAARGILGDAQRAHLDTAQLGLRQQEMEHGAQLARDKAAREGMPGFREQLDLAKFQYDQQKDAANMRRDERNYLSGRIDKHDEKVGKILDTYSTVDGKVDPQKRSIVEKFMANFDKTYEGPPEQYFAELEDRLGIERVLEAQGRSGFTNWGERQKPWSGDLTTGIKEVDAPWYRVGDSKLWEDEYGRRYGSEIEKQMSPKQWEIFKAKYLKQQQQRGQ